jgi:hypothetical protein
MARNEQPKRPRGRPPKFAGVKRQNFNFRIIPATRQQVLDSAAASGRSLSEEIEHRIGQSFEYDTARADIDKARAETLALREDVRKMLREASAIRDAAHVQAIRAAGLVILRETEGRPTRVIVDIETLLAEADGLATGLRSGFFKGESPPAPEAPRQMTAEEAQRALDEIKRTLTDAVEKTRAADAAAAGNKPDEAA